MELPFKTRRPALGDLVTAAHARYRAYRTRHVTHATRAPEPVSAPVVPVVPAAAGEPDVLLDVPSLKVSDIDLEVDGLQARVALQAHVHDLLRIDVGADVSLERVRLGIQGVEAEATLKVRLAHVAQMVDRVMETIDRNPQLLFRLVDHLGGTVEQLGNGTGRAVGQLAGAFDHRLHTDLASPTKESPSAQ